MKIREKDDNHYHGEKILHFGQDEETKEWYCVICGKNVTGLTIKLKVTKEEPEEGCPDCGSLDIKDEGKRGAESQADRAEFRRDAIREDKIINNIK